MGMKTLAVLLMAYGSPDRLEDMEDYLLDIRGGRETPPELVREIQERYSRIGGRSPLLEITRSQAAALETKLNQRFNQQDLRFQAFTGMRHWKPRIVEAVREIEAAGIKEVIAMVMAPHSSWMSTGAYFNQLDQAIQETRADLNVRRVESWHVHPGLIAAIAEKAAAAIENFSMGKPFVIFTAHSLPARILEQGDPYDHQLRETANLLTDRLSLEPGRWMFSYQSAGKSREPWLGPPIEAVVVDLARAGEKELLLVPIGFVSDHVEVLYDIDIVCRELAAGHGARLERSASLNASPAFITAMAEIIAEHLDLQIPNASRMKHVHSLPGIKSPYR
jgi:ferrochelatase